MIGKVDPKIREATVVGAGVAGLLAAYRLDKLGYEVTLHERASRAGGLISTSRTEFGMAESAAHSLAASPPVIEIFRELDVPLVPVNADSRARYVLRDRRLRRFPLGPIEAAGLAWRAVTARAPAGSGEPLTMEAFATRHLGSAARDYLISPFLSGIHAAGPELIDVQAAFPRLALEPGRSLVGAMIGRKKKSPKPMLAPRDGMGAFIAALERRLESRLGARFRRDSEISRLPEAGNLVLCVPAPVASRLLAPVNPSTSAALKGVQYTPLLSATVFARREHFKRAPLGVGVLLPEIERNGALEGVLGVLFNSSSFEGRVSDADRGVSLTMMLGGASRPGFLSLSDSEVRAAVHQGLDAIFGLKAEPQAVVIHRWPQALPLYSRGLVDVWATAERGWCARPGRVLFGNYTGQISVRGLCEQTFV